MQKLDRLHNIKHLTVAAVYGCHVQLMAVWSLYRSSVQTKKKNIY